ncbi:MAG: ATP-dependent RNA helicase HrpA, partial [Syntrophaceae bacterium]|nr:ATP-dependent RNA helicase HrpA [Syntrophaceae bacterium]
VLGILNTILPKRRDLRVVITSATIDTEKFAKAFNGAPIIEVSGRLFPVEVRWRPLDPKLEESGELTPVEAAVRAVDELIAGRERGDILIFMATEQDIREACALLAERCLEKTAILPLFSRLTATEQQRVFRPIPERKIVMATNVAETSITIPGIRYVIDTGLARISQYNPRSRTEGLPVRAISRSSADQRKGRCGRVANGVCIRLYSEENYLGRPLYTPPEIVRSNLAGVILRMLSLGLGDIETFPFIDHPAAKSIRDGIEILRELGAIEPQDKDHRSPTPSWRLTEQGRHMSRLPLDPRISRMILEGKKEGCLREIVVIAAALSIPDPRERPAEKEAQADQIHKAFQDPASDFSALLALWRRCYGRERNANSRSGLRRFCGDHFLSYRRIREWRDIHDQIWEILAERGLTAKRETPSPHQGAEFYASLHKSILSGFLGHIAVKKEKNLYMATQGRQAMIFPGSGLFNHGGQWIAAAEMVETSRLFARTVANIDAAWLEDLGGDLCRRTYASPHWEKNRGEVVASEQVTLFGLVIVPGRPVSFGRIDPAEASKIFIREALVPGEVKRPLPFLSHNLAMIEKLAEIEDKLRRRDIVTSEETMAQFYEKRLACIYDIRTLQRLIRDQGSDSFLRMRDEDLLAREPDAEELALFPEGVSAGGWKLGLSYRYAPGHKEDGVTLKIPVQAIPAVPETSLDWAVPGLLREKILRLLKGLPKEYRKRLMPLNPTVEIVLREMKREAHLLTALSRFLYDRFGVDISSDRWLIDGLEEHLKLRFSVVDEKDKELASGRDLVALRQEFVEEKPARAFSEAKKAYERTGITAWDFGDLPERITLTGQGHHAPIAFPALTAEEEMISLRLYLSETEARQCHRQGVKALYALRFGAEIRHLKKAVAPKEDLKLWASAFGGLKLLETAVLEKVQEDIFSVELRTAAAFVQHGEAVRSRIFPHGQEVLKLIQPPLKALYEATEQLRKLEAASRFNRPVLDFLNGLRVEMTALLPADFLIRYDEGRIAHLSRYLKALSIRAERGAVHLEKVLMRGKEIQELVTWRKQALQDLPPYASTEKHAALEDFRWLIEEYKISLFAQEIKTAGPISRKRLDSTMREIQRML